ncbi:hypothetical protein GQ600_20163 [Phytophthora cactorum]|nr:hypothetical protein GQ600_20163 [Phytophthora cactorum]
MGAPSIATADAPLSLLELPLHEVLQLLLRHWVATDIVSIEQYQTHLRLQHHVVASPERRPGRLGRRAPQRRHDRIFVAWYTTQSSCCRISVCSSRPFQPIDIETRHTRTSKRLPSIQANCSECVSSFLALPDHPVAGNCHLIRGPSRLLPVFISATSKSVPAILVLSLQSAPTATH